MSLLDFINEGKSKKKHDNKAREAASLRALNTPSKTTQDTQADNNNISNDTESNDIDYSKIKYKYKLDIPSDVPQYSDYITVEQLQKDLDNNIFASDDPIQRVMDGGIEKTYQPKDMGELKSHLYQVQVTDAANTTALIDRLYTKKNITDNLSNLLVSNKQIKALSDSNWVPVKDHPIIAIIQKEIEDDKQKQQQHKDGTKVTPPKADKKTKTKKPKQPKPSNNSNNSKTQSQVVDDAIGDTGSATSSTSGIPNNVNTSDGINPVNNSNEHEHEYTPETSDSIWYPSKDQIKQWFRVHIPELEATKFYSFIDGLSDTDTQKLFNSNTLVVLSKIIFNRSSMLSDTGKFNTYLIYMLENITDHTISMSEKYFNELITKETTQEST